MLFIRAAKFATDEGSSDGNFFPWFESKAGGTNRFCICWFLDAEKEDRGREGKKIRNRVCERGVVLAVFCVGSVIQHKPGSSFLRDLSAHKHARKQEKQG